MSENKKKRNRLDLKILYHFTNNSKANFNYRQIASLLDIKDTKGRNNIISSLKTLHNQEKLLCIKPGQYQLKKATTANCLIA